MQITDSKINFDSRRSPVDVIFLERLMRNKFEQKIKKRHLAATIHFAISHIPQVDEATLVRLGEMVNITGNFNAISYKQLLTKMNLPIRLVPGTCQYSLSTLIEILDVCGPLVNGDELNLLWSINQR